METQTSNSEGEASPTPDADMSTKDSAQSQDADQPKVEEPKVEAKPAEVLFAEKVLGREFESVEEAEKTLSNLNSLVGDQTVSKQRKAIESLAKQANLSTDELIEVIDAQATNPIEPEAVSAPEQAIGPSPVDATTKRVIRIETDSFVKDVPEAEVIKDTLFAESLQTGKSVSEIWRAKYAPIIDAGKKLGAKKLQTTTEGQPLKASSAEVDQTDTKLDVKKMSIKEMEEHLGFQAPPR